MFEYQQISLRLITVIVPVAIYFLLVGFLNSRRNPQLMTGRRDFALLMAALSPLIIVPLYGFLNGSIIGFVAAILASTGLISLAAPRDTSWVIYNMPAGAAEDIVLQVLNSLGRAFKKQGGGFKLEGGGFVKLGSFVLLRNITIRLLECDSSFAKDFETTLTSKLAGVSAETTPAALVMLMLAATMLVAPLALAANHVPEIVRLITDLLY